MKQLKRNLVENDILWEWVRDDNSKILYFQIVLRKFWMKIFVSIYYSCAHQHTTEHESQTQITENTFVWKNLGQRLRLTFHDEYLSRATHKRIRKNWKCSTKHGRVNKRNRYTYRHAHTHTTYFQFGWWRIQCAMRCARWNLLKISILITITTKDEIVKRFFGSKKRRAYDFFRVNFYELANHDRIFCLSKWSIWFSLFNFESFLFNPIT